MEAYYDEDKKVWVFPGEDPADVAAPLPPPPKAPMVPTASAPAAAEEPKLSNNDPLAAMMAPPKRGPSARPKVGAKPSPHSMPIMFPPGMMPAGASAPKVSVFKPKPDGGKKENEESAESEK